MIVIEDKRKTNIVYFEEINCGDCFIYDDNLYMRINGFNLDKNPNAINLETAYTKHFLPTAEVIGHIDVSIVIVDSRG